MTFFLQKKDFDFLKKQIPYAYKMVTNIKEMDDKVYFDVDNVSDFQDEITMETVDSGMDNDDTVNQKGREMYFIYDTLLEQKRMGWICLISHFLFKR